jgi:hypothetical protein
MDSLGGGRWVGAERPPAGRRLRLLVEKLCPKINDRMTAQRPMNFELSHGICADDDTAPLRGGTGAPRMQGVAAWLGFGMGGLSDGDLADLKNQFNAAFQGAS